MKFYRNLICFLPIFLWHTFLIAEEPAKPPANKEIVEITPTENFNRMAFRFLQMGEFDKAKTHVDKALALTPKNHYSLLILTEILVKTEKFDEARIEVKNVFPNLINEQLFFLSEKCLEPEPASKGLRNQALLWAKEIQILNKHMDRRLSHLLAKAYFRNNELDKALEISKPSIEKNPKNSHLHILLGNIYTKKGDYELAAKHLAKGMNREPSQPYCYNHISYQLLTYDEETDNRPIIALSYAILASDATNQKIADIEDTLALAYFKTNDINSAINAQDRAVKNLTLELPEEQKVRSTKLMGFKKQLSIYQKALKESKN